MRKILALIILIPSILSLTSCLYKSRSAEELMADFLTEYRGTGTVFTPKAVIGEEGYISEKMKANLFSEPSLIPLDYAVYIYSRLDAVSEVGILSSVGAPDLVDVTDICLERLALLSSLAEGESGIIRAGGLIIYYFSADAELPAALRGVI